MDPIFTAYKKIIDSYLLRFLESKKDELAQVNTYGPDLLSRVKEMAVAGKSIRGALVLFAFCFTNKMPSEEAIKLATAVEVLQTSLLIHDDIMDRDTTRRGLPSMHVQYKSDGMAMCVGDVLFFLAFELLGSVRTDAVTLGRIVRFVGREYQSVCVAQMEDLSKTAKTKEAIISLYTYKTARYTFAVPLMLGAMLAGTTKDMLKYLESFGVSAGILFQIRDDILDQQKTLGADVVAAYQTGAVESLKRLPISDDNKKILGDLLHFIVERTK